MLLLNRLTGFNSGSNTSGSYYFNGGSSDYLYFSGGTAVSFGSGTYTVEAWINFSSTSGVKHILCIGAYNSSGAAFHIYNSKIRLFRAGTQIAVGTTTINSDTWYHLAWTRDGSGNTRLFVNGNLEVTVTDTGSISESGHGTSYISNGYASVGLDSGTVPGYISNLRVGKTALYTSNFTPPDKELVTIAGTQIVTCKQPSIADYGPSSIPISISGSVSVSNFGIV